MSTKFTGRQFNLGAAKEATRGTALAAVYWLPYTSLTIDDEVKTVKDENVYGIIEKGIGQENVLKMSKATLAGDITDLGFGLLLKAGLGSETATLVSGETVIYDHKFTVLENAQHPTLTLSVVEPNSNSGSGYGYALAAIDTLSLSFDIEKYCTYKATFMGNLGANLANTTSYTVENRFRPQDGIIKFAATLSGLSGGTTMFVKKATIDIKKNVIADVVIGNLNPVDNLNQEFECSGTLELFYVDRTWVDTYLTADAKVAFSLAFANTNITLGVASNPTLTIRLANVKLESVARKVDPKGITTETLKFTAFYSVADTEMLDITLRNARTTAY